MNIYLQLLMAAAVPVLLAVLFYVLQRKTPFKKIPFIWQQVIIGIFFGGAAVLGTEFGVDIGGAVANARDAAVLTAGLIFGGPAGIIAGVIGGVERWFATYWGAGAYSQIACSVSTCFAGFYAAFLRKFMFDDKRPASGFAFATGVVMEVLHLTILFLTHLSDAQAAMEIVQKCTLPMVVCNSVSVGVAVLVVNLISAGTHKSKGKQRKLKISQKMQLWLLLLVVVGYFATTLFVYDVQTSTAEETCKQLFKVNIADVQADVLGASDKNLLRLTREIALEIDGGNDDLAALASKYGVAEINIVPQDGVITHSTNPDFVGYDMKSDADKPENERQSSLFMVLVTDDSVTEYVQEYRPINYNASISRKYAGVVLAKGGFVQVGYNAEEFQADISDSMQGFTKNRHIGETGYIVVADIDADIVSDNKSPQNNTLASIGLSKILDREQHVMYSGKVHGQNAKYMYAVTEGYYVIAVMPDSEVFVARDALVYINSFMEVIVFAMLFIMVYLLIKRLVVNDIRSVNGSLSRIIAGDLNEVVNVQSSAEFASLSTDINTTVNTLKNYIAEAAARIDRELEFANAIQHAALPAASSVASVRQVDIAADMFTAKEVGGDFYDFYRLGDNKLAFLIADVSGKGVPAAMFMMTSKTMLKNLAETGLAVSDVLTKANAKLCDSNDAGMFVTTWFGILDTATGEVSFANAGHNPPIVYRKGHGASYLRSKAGFVLAGMDNMHYSLQSLHLSADDSILLYTDGVTEATNANGELYGEQRLLDYVSSHADLSMADLISGIKDDIDLFTTGAEQFDDITMVALTYYGEMEMMNEREFEASDSELMEVTEFVEEELAKAKAMPKVQMQINLALEEVFVNVAHYAYPDGVGKVSVGVKVENGEATICIKDSGRPFNPLEQNAPDISLNANERQIGGLGIFLVKKTMDDVTYAYRNGLNVLTMKKKIN